jgi:hypothetical protein
MRGLILLLAFAGVAGADEECTTTTTVRCTGGPLPAPQFAPQLMWHDEPVSTANPRVWGAGLALFGASWLAAGVVSLDHSALPAIGFFPVIGAWMAAASNRNDCSQTKLGCDNAPNTALWVLDGVAQAAGFVTLLVGLSAGPKKIERRPILVVPTGAGFSAIGHF